MYGGVNMKGTKVIVTYNCNMMCYCCEYKCAPYKKGIMGVNDFRNKVFTSYSEGYIDYIDIAGGEPFLNPGMIFKYFKAISKIDSKKIVSTNGYWGNIEPFIDILVDLKKQGLNEIIIEYDYYHSPFIDINTIKEAIIKTLKCGIEISIKAYLNTKNLGSIEDIRSYEYIKEIKNEFKNIKLIFTNTSQNKTSRSSNEKIILFKL